MNEFIKSVHHVIEFNQLPRFIFHCIELTFNLACSNVKRSRRKSVRVANLATSKLFRPLVSGVEKMFRIQALFDF